MDKFTVSRKSSVRVGFRPIQIRNETYDMIKQMQEDTGESIVELIDSMVRFCAERLDIIED